MEYAIAILAFAILSLLGAGLFFMYMNKQINGDD